MGDEKDKVILNCIEDFKGSRSHIKEQYFGIYPTLNVDSQEETINFLIKKGFYKRHPYADLRLKNIIIENRSPLNEFFIAYYITYEFIDDIYQSLNNRYVSSAVFNDIIEIEMVTKTNLKYLNSKSDKLSRLSFKINKIYETEDPNILYYLSLYNNDHSEEFLKGFSKMDVARSFGKVSILRDEFDAWDKIYHNYIKGETPKHDEIPGLEKWQRIASIDLELKYYLELQVRMDELIKKDYFNSTSHIKIYDTLSVHDSNLLDQIVPILKHKTDLKIIENIIIDHNDRDSAFFNNLFKYFFNLVPKHSRFKTVDYISFQNIIKKCYPHLKDFTINSNSLSRRMERSFKNLDPFDENDEN
jgi:hypothetical protein